MNPLALHELADIMEGAWNGRRPVKILKRGWKVRVGPAKEPTTMLFDRRRRIVLLWDLLFIALFLLLLVALVAGVR